MLHRSLACLALTALLFQASSSEAQQTQRRSGIEGRQAPALDVDSWHGLPEGVETVDMAKLRGKVVYLFFFQSWCPGCHRHGFPTMKSVHESFGEAEDVSFLAVQTVFEGYGSNTPEKGLKDVRDFGLDIPFGHAAGRGEHDSPDIMRSFRSGGTPWTVIIDKQGKVRFNDFRIQPDHAKRLVESLRAED